MTRSLGVQIEEVAAGTADVVQADEPATARHPGDPDQAELVDRLRDRDGRGWEPDVALVHGEPTPLSRVPVGAA